MNYQQMQRRVTSLLQKYDKRSTPIQLKVRGTGGINTSTGQYQASTEVTHNLTGVVINYNDNQYDGTMIMVGDIGLIIDSTIKPNVGDYVVLDGDTFTVLQPITTWNPGGTVLGYQCNLRR